MDHWPVKLLPREGQDFMTWGCEGCTEIFKTKKEFNKHFLAELRKSLSSEQNTKEFKTYAKRLSEETRKLVEIASLWSRVDDHTYCHDDVPGGCVVLQLRNAIESVEDILLEE